MQHTPARGRNPGRATNAGTAQKIVEDCFRLIIGMMCQKNPVGGMVFKSLVANSTCRSFHTLAALTWDTDPNHRQRNGLRLAGHRAGVSPCVGISTEAMMHVERRQLKICIRCEAICGVQQHCRVEPAGKTDDERMILPDVPGKAGSDSLQDGLSEWLVP